MTVLIEMSALDVAKWAFEILIFAIAIYAFIRFLQRMYFLFRSQT